MARIDFILISKDLKNKIIKTDIKPVVSGDHNAVTIVFKFDSIKSGPGFWKFNTNLLTKGDYCDEVRKIILNITKEKTESCISWRDTRELCKIKIKEYSINYTKNRKTKDDCVKTLESRLQIK